MFNLPPITRTLIIINVIVFFLQRMLGDITLYLALWQLQSGSPFFPMASCTAG